MAASTKSISNVGITGAEGHIGTTLRLGIGDAYNIKSFTLTAQEFPSTVANLSDAAAVSGIFKGLDAIIHLAAEPSPQAGWDNVLQNNIIATHNVFEEARQAGVKKIVFASTNHTQHGATMKTGPADLDTSLRFMMRLDDPPAPDSLYGVTKLFGEDLGRYYARFFDLQVVALRIGATFAADDPSKRPNREDFMRAMFLSKRDCVQAFEQALQVDTSFLVAYAVSNNTRRVFDLRETTERLGFVPQDNAEDYF
jgi:nucleoside-diphosphate-sugar epimerase